MKVTNARQLLYSVGLFFFSFQSVYATVGPITPGQSLWNIAKRVGETDDIIESKVCAQMSQLDVIESLLDSITTVSLTLVIPCAPTEISSATTISSAGTYCVANDIAGALTVAASDVLLDLNHHHIADGITVNGGLSRITIQNGSVSGSGDGILVNGDTRNITISNVVAKNAIRGINFNNVYSGMIKNCEMTLNTAGLELDNAHNIIVQDCIAAGNTHTGFDLISSTTICVQHCKALSTGAGNTEITGNTVFGFAATNGRANIFENCIANSTQALLTTDFNSVIAGFILRGTESCTKIIGCEAANSTASPFGVTVPHGILLEGRLENVAILTGAERTAGPISAVAWSPDGKYLAIGQRGNNVGIFEIYFYDRLRNSLTRVAVASSLTIGDGFGVDWSPNGNYIALAASTLDPEELFLFSFNPSNNTLTQVQVLSAGGSGLFRSVGWSPTGEFLAAGASGSATAPQFRIYSFDPVNETLTQVDGLSFSDIGSISWSPDGEYIVTGGLCSDPACLAVPRRVFSFDKQTQTITLVASSSSSFGVAWSPDGKFLAAAEGNNLIIASFDRTDNSAMTIASMNFPTNVISVSWSPDGKYIVEGREVSGTVGIFYFNRTNNSLTQVDSVALPGNLVQVRWSPDGGLIAAITPLAIGNEINIIRALTFPEKNVIKNNTVYCNSGNECPAGVGISGSAIANLIIQNVAYSNPIPRGINAPIVSSNYQFVTNVFEGNSGGFPNPFQNVAYDGCAPVCQTEDIAERICVIEQRMRSSIDLLADHV